MSEEEDKKISEFKDTALARIDVMPPNFKLSVGDKGTFTKEQLIAHIKSCDETGIQVIKMQMNFIRALTSGQLMETLNS